MIEDQNNGSISRRRFLGVGSAVLGATAIAAAGLPEALHAEGERNLTSPIGPDNRALHAQNPDSVSPLPTDHGHVKPFKYPFAFSHKRVTDGGWARQVTIEDLPISTSIAGVDMRLNAGGIRELHWHTANEWALMLYGSARITCLGDDGKPFIDDVKEGDLWFFPLGQPHSIQGLAPDGCEFLLVFDDGAFSEYNTISLTDWMAHTPLDVLVKNLNIPDLAFSRIPDHELYILQGEVPRTSLAEDRRAAAGTVGLSSQNFVFRLMEMLPTHQTKAGEARIVDSSVFPASTGIAAAHVIVHPGGMRELHWHQNADEWQYYVAGKGRMTVFAAGGDARTMDFQKGDVGYVQQNLPHYIENTGTEDLIFLEMFKSSSYREVSLNQWLTHLPPALVQAHSNIDPELIQAIPHTSKVIVPG